MSIDFVMDDEVLLPPVSAVEVRESVPSVCAHLRGYWWGVLGVQPQKQGCVYGRMWCLSAGSFLSIFSSKYSPLNLT